MSNYRRNYVPGGTYFFTLVTYRRRPILTTELGRRVLGDAMREEQQRAPFITVAIVLLPDHLHVIWTLPPDDSDYSRRWSNVKGTFTEDYLDGGGQEAPVNASRHQRRERGVWQRRFWEHTVHDEDDLKRCLDYVHYNPVKHGLVESVRDYPWSSFHRWVERGEYESNWGANFSCPEIDGAEWE